MKNKIWRNWKMTGAALIMSCSLLMGSGSAVLGAELAESDIISGRCGRNKSARRV